MACLDVESPSICRGKFKSVLQLCLQQRRSREQLVEQGIMPPLKSPAVFHEKIRNLERARTGNFLKHKLCSRPERSELIRMHILKETQAEPSLQAAQLKLKRARLADDLNEKIAQRPGPMELVEKNILPVDSAVEGAADENAGRTPSSRTPEGPDVYNFDEDSSEACSPVNPCGQPSPSSASASPQQSGGNDTPSSNSPVQRSPKPTLKSTVDSVKLSFGRQQSNQPVAPSAAPGPVLIKQSLAKLPADKSRSKKSKEPKPRVKKLKYHQYIPPDQKQELAEVSMDSAYARLLQQQQQFLQLQILSQQQEYSYQTILPTAHKPTSEVQTSCSSATLSGNAALTSTPLRHPQAGNKPDRLPTNLDDMKVAELKMELKLRSLPVSGTKTDLIERLKMYRENSGGQAAAAVSTETTVMSTSPQSENTRLTPPVSPIACKVSSLGIEDSRTADSPARMPSGSPSHDAAVVSSPHGAVREECAADTKAPEKDSEKDKRLHEKERQIEELMRKLEREQRLVEELKMQLEVEKRIQQGDSPPRLCPSLPVQVKEENPAKGCSVARGPAALAGIVKEEDSARRSPGAIPNQLIVSHQVVTRPETARPVQTGAPILLPASLPASAVALRLPAKGLKLHTTVSSSAPGPGQTSGRAPQKTEASAVLQKQCSQTLTKTWRIEAEAQNLLNTFPVNGFIAGASSGPPVPTDPSSKPLRSSQSALVVQQPKFRNHVSKCKDPPRYEDAVKQTRSLLTAAQGPTAASQQMDDLFDVLIESGEISPFVRQDPSSLGKPLPVTASVTTLPINTALSRPPALVQVAHLPSAPTCNSQLNALLDGTLAADREPQKLKLIEELHSPVAGMEVDFNESAPPSPLNLHHASMDGMDWLDLTLSVPAEGGNPLDVSMPVGVFSSDFLNSHELHLNWE